MSNTAEVLERYSKVMFPAVTPYHGENPLVADRAKDQYIWDIEGRRYLDFFGGILTGIRRALQRRGHRAHAGPAAEAAAYLDHIRQ